jgi:glycerol-3-phosphate acyltransferase PlsX
MEDDPSTATRRKKDSSMSVAFKPAAGRRGGSLRKCRQHRALLTGATLTVKRVRGVRRACLAPVLPNGGRGVILLDGCANSGVYRRVSAAVCLYGHFYSHHILGCASPRVGLLNIGTRRTKGTELQKQAYSLLSQAWDAGRLRFVGNTEARDVFSGNVDVLVCDGFSGNILLKSAEGSVVYVLGLIRDILMSNARTKLAAVMIKNDLKQLKKKLDVREVGGTALLRISKPVIKAHGSSDARAIRSAVSKPSGL